MFNDAVRAVGSVFPVPDQYTVFDYLLYPVQGNAVSGAIGIHQLKCEIIIRIEIYLPERGANNPVFHAIIISDLKFAPGEPGVPANAIQQFMYRYHNGL